MCEFISWVKRDKYIYFLTGDQLYRSEQGRICRIQSGRADDDCGHGMIRLFYGLEGGEDKECSNFSKPANFPVPIRLALLDGSMKGFPFPCGIISERLYADYAAKLAPLNADYKAKRDSLNADYKAKRDSLGADYNAKCKSLGADYRVKCKSLDADYKAKRDSLDAEMWELATLPENRTEAWT